MVQAEGGDEKKTCGEDGRPITTVIDVSRSVAGRSRNSW
jgi:hypothetical protein